MSRQLVVGTGFAGAGGVTEGDVGATTVATTGGESTAPWYIRAGESIGSWCVRPGRAAPRVGTAPPGPDAAWSKPWGARL